MPTFTREAIKTAFISLLGEKPLSKITVKDIVERCGVNRNTFYYHFPDLPSLVEAVVTEDAQRIIEGHPSVSTIEDCLSTAIRFILDHKQAVLHIYHSVNRDLFEAYEWRVCRHVVELYLSTLLGERRIARQDWELLVDYLSCSLFGLVMGWLETGLEEGIQDRFQRLCQLKQGEMVTLLERCETA